MALAWAWCLDVPRVSLLCVQKIFRWLHGRNEAFWLVVWIQFAISNKCIATSNNALVAGIVEIRVIRGLARHL